MKAKKAITIMKNFGFMYLLKRFKEYRLRNKFERMRNDLYERNKPKEKTIINVLGNKIIIDPAEHGVHRDLWIDNIREPLVTSEFISCLRPDDIVVECGANIGYYALLEAQRVKKVYAVEPYKKTFDQLNDNIKLNGYTNIETECIGFSDKKGKEKLYINRKSNWNTFREQDKINEDNYVECDMNTIDNFFSNKPKKPTVIRMDVEGYEGNILKGAKETLKSIRMIFLELHGDMIPSEDVLDIIKLIESCGLRICFIAKYDRPMICKRLSPAFIDNIKRGDVGNYEMIFRRDKT